ncbi:hypothetical protein DB346_20115 [Verrucomicrobia bacterium LW23]|nr:hypothetical protein DB346_20115 [Verrucomicrobia bacterium LW23]
MLYYDDGVTEVKLGDRVVVQRFFFLRYSGIVWYLPGYSEAHPEMVVEGMELWAVQTNGSNLFVFPFDGEERAPSNVIFVSRGSTEGIGFAPVESLIMPGSEPTPAPVENQGAEDRADSEAEAEANSEPSPTEYPDAEAEAAAVAAEAVPEPEPAYAATAPESPAPPEETAPAPESERSP